MSIFTSLHKVQKYLHPIKIHIVQTNLGINITFCIAVSQNSSSSSSSEDEIIKEFIKDLASSTSDNEKIVQQPQLEKVIDLSSEDMNSKINKNSPKKILEL